MASELHVSRISVFNAYAQLQSEGYLETSVGSGTCVARTIPDQLFKPSVMREPGGVREHVRPAPRKVSRRAAALSNVVAEPWLHNLGAFRVSLPALDFFPLNVWSRLVARHCRDVSRAEMAYGDTMGYPPFRSVIAEYLSAFRGVRCDASQILVTCGSQQALQISAQVLLNPGDSVFIEEPGYPGARLAFVSAGARVIPQRVDQEGMVTPKIKNPRSSRSVAYITPSHQYPLGMTMSAARRMSLLNWASRSNSWIIEDDYDSEYRFTSRPIPSLQGLDANNRVIYMGTFSKVLFPALRVAYLVVPKDLVPFFSAARDAADIFSSTFYQAILADFISEGHFTRHIRKMRMLYMERRQALASMIDSHIGELGDVVGAEAGMHLTVVLRTDIDDVRVSQFAADNGISAMPLSTCYLKPPTRGGLILGYGGITIRQIQEALPRLASITKRCA
jgi:GntR family transcriptional regulator/MocR family aminotransferase